MVRAAAMLLAGTIALAPAAAAGETFACKDAQGNWVISNVQPRGCVGKVQRETRSSHEARARPVPTSRSGAEVRAILLAPTAYREHIRRAAEKYALSEELLHAVMAVESGFRASAISDKGAMGLMQLMPGTAKDMYVRDVWSPEENIDGGARYLRTLANQYDGDLVRTLAAYNAGPEAVKRAGGVPSYPETRDYVRRVLAIYEALKSKNASSRSDG